MQNRIIVFDFDLKFYGNAHFCSEISRWEDYVNIMISMFQFDEQKYLILFKLGNVEKKTENDFNE